MTAGKKRTKDEVKELVESFGYVYINDYHVDPKHRKVIVQDEFGYKYDVQLSHLLNPERGLRFIDISNPFVLDNISLWLRLNNSQFELLDNNEYKGNQSKLNLYCKKCCDYPKISWDDILSGSGCGICKGFQVGIYHNLEVQNPILASEWHPTKNGYLTTKDVTYGSNKKVWWLCPNGHEYFSAICDRSSGNNCKKCSNIKRESSIATELKSYILNKYSGEEEYSIFRNPETNRPLPYDIYIYGGENPEINGVYIEIHWNHHYGVTMWHKMKSDKNKTTPQKELEYQKHKDRIKRGFAKKKGTYIEVDLRKIKTTKDAIDYVESFLSKTLLL